MPGYKLAQTARALFTKIKGEQPPVKARDPSDPPRQPVGHQSREPQIHSTHPLPLQVSASKDFADQILEWHAQASRHPRISLGTIDIARLVGQFNRFLESVVADLDQHTVWDPQGTVTENQFVPFHTRVNDEPAIHGHAFVPHYRESTVLIRLTRIDSETLGTHRFACYEEPTRKFSQQKSRHARLWASLSAMLSTGQGIVNFISLQQKPGIGEPDHEQLQSLLESFLQLHSAFIKQRKQFLRPPTTQGKKSYTSAFFYPISDEDLANMSGFQLATVCFEELAASQPSSLISRIVTQDDLWKEMEAALNTPEAFKGRHDNPDTMTANLKKLRAQSVEDRIRACKKQYEAFCTAEPGQLLQYKIDQYQAFQQLFTDLPKSEHQKIDTFANLTIQQDNAECYQLIKDHTQASIAPQHIAECADLIRWMNTKEIFNQDTYTNLLHYSPAVQCLKRSSESKETEVSSETLRDLLRDKHVLNAIQSSNKEQLTTEEFTDFLKIQRFHDEHVTEPGVEPFYQEALAIRLSNEKAVEQIQRMKQAAHAHLQHTTEAYVGRLLLDALMLIASLCVGLGILIGICRKATGHTFFFSTAPAAAEKAWDTLATSILEPSPRLF